MIQKSDKFDRETKLEKMMELFEAEQMRYKKELERNPNYRIVYHEKRGFVI